MEACPGRTTAHTTRRRRCSPCMSGGVWPTGCRRMLPAIASLEHCCQRLHRLNIAASECLVIWELHLRAPRGSVRGEHRAPRGERNPTCAPNLCAQPVHPTCAPNLCARPVYAFPSPSVSLSYAPNATLHASYMRRCTQATCDATRGATRSATRGATRSATRELQATHADATQPGVHFL